MGQSKGYLDGMYIPIRKIAEGDLTVTYQFESNYWIQDPENPKRNKIYATYQGKIVVDKTTKECTVIEAMPFDKGGIALRAMSKIRKQTKHGEYPDSFMYASG